MLCLSPSVKKTGDGAGAAFMKKYVAQPRLPEHARYSKAKEMIEKKVMTVYRYSTYVGY